MSKMEEKETGGVLGFSLIGILFVLSLVAISSQSPLGNHAPNPTGNFFMGIYLICWGAMFLSSYFFSHKTFFFRGLLWVCENLSNPGSKKMAFFYFALPTAIGLSLIVKGIGAL